MRVPGILLGLSLALTACEVQPIVSTPVSTLANSISSASSEATNLDDSETASDLADTDGALILTDSASDTATNSDAVNQSDANKADTSQSDINQSDINQSDINQAKTAIDGILDNLSETISVSSELPQKIDADTSEAQTTEMASLATVPQAPIKAEEAEKPAGQAQEDVIIAPQPEPARIIPKQAPLPQLQPASLVGLTDKSLVSEIGEADFVRLEGHMRIWQYKTASCVVDFFLYPVDDGAVSTAYLVTDWYGRARDFGAPLDTKRCQEDLATRQAF